MSLGGKKMRKKTVIIPLVIFVVFLACSIVSLIKPSYAFSIKKEVGDIRNLKGLSYGVTLSDERQQWKIHADGENIRYTTSFLDTDEEIPVENKAFSDGFYLYIPQLMDGTKLSDYEKSKTLNEEYRKDKYADIEFYNVDKVNLDLMIRTKDGYACFDTGLSKAFTSNNTDTIAYNTVEKQSFFQAKYEQEGYSKGNYLHHPYITLGDKTYVALYETGQGSSGQYAVYQIDALYKDKGETMPNVEDVKKATKAKVFIGFPPEVNGISDIVAYQDELYVVINRKGQIEILKYDLNGNLKSTKKIAKEQTFSRLYVQDGKLFLYTIEDKKHHLMIYEGDKELVNIYTDFSLTYTKMKYENGKVYLLNAVKNKDKETSRFEVSVYDRTKLLFRGYLTGEYLDDTKAMNYKPNENEVEVIPSFYHRDIIRYYFE